MIIRLKIGNTFDLPGTRYSDPFYHYRTLDQRHALQYWYVGNKSRLEAKKAEGKEVKEKIITYDEYEIKFICDVDFGHIIASLPLLDYFVVTINDVEITPEEWDVERFDLPDYNESFTGWKITYRMNFMDSKTGNTNYEVDADNHVPVASSVYISGANTIGSTLTGNYSYTDNEGDLEGTSTFRWWRADTASQIGIALIGGATAQTYDLTTSDYNKYIFFEVVPVALTGNTPGLSVKSSGFQVETNSAPIAIDLIITTPSENYEVFEIWTGGYDFIDSDGDSEGTSLYYWQKDDDGSGDTKILVGNALTFYPSSITSYVGKYLRFGIKPVAVTGVNGTTIYWGGWQIVNESSG